MVGYVVEGWVTPEKNQESIDLFRAALDKQELSSFSREFANEQLNHFEPLKDGYWLGYKGFKSYAAAKAEMAQYKMKNLCPQWRVVKASFPNDKTWFGYKIIPW